MRVQAGNSSDMQRCACEGWHVGWKCITVSVCCVATGWLTVLCVAVLSAAVQAGGARQAEAHNRQGGPPDRRSSSP